MNEELKQAFETFLNTFRDSEPVIRYNNAKELYMADGRLVALINQYNVQAQLLRDEGAKEERDDELISQITGKLKELYDEIMRNDNMTAMQEAEQEISAILDSINRGLMSVVRPEDAGGCSGSCSSCSGCH